MTEKLEFDPIAHGVIRKNIYRMLVEDPFYALIVYGAKFRQSLEVDGFDVQGYTITYNPAFVLANSDNGKLIKYSIQNCALKMAMRHEKRVDRLVNNSIPWLNRDKEQRKKIAEASRDAALSASDAAINWIIRRNLNKRELNDVDAALSGDGDHYPFLSRSKDDGGAWGSGYPNTLEGLYKYFQQNPPPPMPQSGEGEGQGGGGSSRGRSSAESSVGEGGQGGGSEEHNLDGSPSPSEGPGSPQDGDQGDSEAKIASAVKRAEERSKEVGKLPGNLEELLVPEAEGHLDWKELVRKELGGGVTNDQDWSRPNRRYIAEGTYLAGNPYHGPGEIVIAVDNSGSVQHSLLKEFMNEMAKVNEDLRPQKTHIIAVDTRVNAEQEFGPYDRIEMNIRGGGGTAFSPAFKWVEDKGIHPKMLIYFTDGCASDFGPKPPYPVLWCLWPGYDIRAPFGEVMKMSESDTRK